MPASRVTGTHFQGGEHLTLLLAIDQAVMVLHRDEGREVVRDGVVYEGGVSDRASDVHA